MHVFYFLAFVFLKQFVFCLVQLLFSDKHAVLHNKTNIFYSKQWFCSIKQIFSNSTWPAGWWSMAGRHALEDGAPRAGWLAGWPADPSRTYVYIPL